MSIFPGLERRRRLGMVRNPTKKKTKKTAKPPARASARKPAKKAAKQVKKQAAKKPAAKSAAPLHTGPSNVSWNFKLLAHDTLAGFGGMGEGMAVQVAQDGRRILWLPHENAPENFIPGAVADPRTPQRVGETQ